jgi:hypothetical protein
MSVLAKNNPYVIVAFAILRGEFAIIANICQPAALAYVRTDNDDIHGEKLAQMTIGGGSSRLSRHQSMTPLTVAE